MDKDKKIIPNKEEKSSEQYPPIIGHRKVKTSSDTSKNKYDSKNINPINLSKNDTFILNKKRKLDFSYEFFCKSLNFENNNFSNTAQNCESLNDLTENEPYISKFNEEFLILKTLNKNITNNVYLCHSKKDGKIYVIKESKIINYRKYYETIRILIDEIDLNKNNCLSIFIEEYKDFWIEEITDELEVKKSIYSNYKSYLLSNYYKNGNLKMFLQNLKDKQFILTSSYLWDIIFEMIISVYFLHSLGYIHFNIKPSNYLINDNGCLILSDFYLTKKESEIISHKVEAPDGDSRYISPELFYEQSKKISHKTDIYSLGLSILEILINEDLPTNGNIWQNIRKNGIPQELLDKIPKFSDGSHEKFTDIILKMTNINSENRIDLEYLLNDKLNCLNLINKFALLKRYKYNNDILKNIMGNAYSSLNIDEKYISKNLDINKLFVKKSKSVENICKKKNIDYNKSVCQ